MDDIPKARGTKPSSTAAASRYAFEASGVRFVRRIHSSDSRKVSSERFIEPPGIRAPMTRFTTDIQMRFRDIDFILAHVDIDFESQAVWGDEIQVTAWPSKIGTSSFTLTYEVSEKRSGRVLARAKSVQVSYDYENKKSKPIPPEFRRLLEGALEG